MKKCPFCNRTFHDDTYQFCLEDGSMLSSVFNANATLVLNGSSDLEVTLDLNDPHTKPKRTFVVKKNPTEKPQSFITDPVVAICINEQFPHCKTADDLYTCTRGLWRLSRERAERADYVFAIYKGVIKEVYELERWLPATKTFSDFWIEKLRSQGRILHAGEHIGRYEFTGHLAPEAVRKKYLGRTIPKRHKGNPIMYFNC